MDGFRKMAAAIAAAIATVAALAPASAQNPSTSRVLSTVEGSGQAFPNKPIRFIAGGAGSPADMRARQVAQKLKESLGQPVVVDNRPGANGAIGARLAAKATPDGYTLFNCSSVHMMNELLNPDASSRLNNDFVPITKLTSGWLILAVHPGIPVASLRDFIDLAKTKPGTLRYSAASQGSLSHLLGEWMKLNVGIHIRAVYYKFTSAEIPDVLGGHIDATFNYFNILGPYIQTGKLRALAVASPKRLQVAPDIATMSDAGLAGMEANGWNGVCVPAGVRQPIVDILYRDVVKALADPSIRDQMIATGAEPGGERPEEFAAFIRFELEKWGKVIKVAGIVLQ